MVQNQLTQKYYIEYRIIDNVKQISSIFKKLIEENRKIVLLILEGHGSEDCLQLNKKEELNLTEHTLSQVNFDLLPEDTSIVLNSCSTGAGANSLAQKIANASSRGVFAPDSMLCGSLKISFDQGISVETNDSACKIRTFTRIPS
jgi:hypothetical protein